MPTPVYSDCLTPEQAIVLAVLKATQTVMREQEAKLEAYAARLREVSDAQDGWSEA